MAISPTIKDRASEITDAVLSIEDLYQDYIIEKIQRLKQDSLIGFDIAVKSIAKKLDVSQATLRTEITQTSMKKYIKDRDKSVVRDVVAKEWARDLLKGGHGYTWMYETWQSMHYGDKPLGMLYSLTSINGAVKNTNGIHTEANGDAGSGLGGIHGSGGSRQPTLHLHSSSRVYQ